MDDLRHKLALDLAGRAAEVLVFGEGLTSSGAENDLKSATRTASEIVRKYGLGLILRNRGGIAMIVLWMRSFLMTT